ncbi:copper amine oxidase N-terminal domain-containing protein [Ureibacillus sinduriensis]|uniref:copper amine oxidase N-terminal domain-containing protein n=1 Tax=Ureibacillus sinduriensis TaxID=561440 RepID=UPI00068B4221|nr:copper amine oxidase N-terminal domain-containing protein [Ureibacillus sinduriensis]
MKYFIKISILAIGLLLPFTLSNNNVEAATPISVKINSQELYFDQQPIMENGRVLVPMRAIFEAMGAKIEWSDRTKTVKATNGSIIVSLTLNSKQATINGKKKDLDVPGKSVNGRTLVPLRFVSEALGANVEWKSNQSLVLITFDGEVKEQTGKVYPDGWVAPVLKTPWSSDPAVNFRTLENELGFNNRGVYSLPSYPGVISVIGQSSSSSNEVGIKFMGWTDPALKYSERIPVVAKEVFKLYFGSDANRVWNYFNSNDIPEQFTANGRKVTATFSPADGSVSLTLGHK